MSLSEPTEQSVPDPIPPSLAQRRPGHAVMTTLLEALDQRRLSSMVPADLASWHVGAIGEQLVGAELARLPEDWHILHAVPAGPIADIDHLVFGPPGVFVINTKRHPGKRIRVGTHVIWIDGFQQSAYQRDLLARTAKVRAALGIDEAASVEVHPLLVFVDATSVSAIGEQSVLSCSAGQLIDRLSALEPTVPSTDLAELFARACRPATWGRDDAVLQEPDPTARFVDLTVRRPSSFVSSSPLRTRTRAGSISTDRRTYAARQSAANRLVIRIMAAILSLVLAPVAVVVGVEIFTALVRALLLR